MFFSRNAVYGHKEKSNEHGTRPFVGFDTEMKSAWKGKVNFTDFASFFLSADSISVKYHGVLHTSKHTVGNMELGEGLHFCANI